MLRLHLALSLLIFTSLLGHASDSVILEPVLKNVEGVPGADLRVIVEDLRKTSSRNLDELAESVRFVFQKHGYFKVFVEEPVMPTTKLIDNKKSIPVTLFVTAGQKYRLRGIRFTDSSVLFPSELRAGFPIEDGDIFDREKVAVDLESVRKLYGNKGYMFLSAVPDTEIDDSAHTIALKVDLDEGPLCYAGSLTVGGEESQPGAREKLLKTWKSYQGRVYDLHTLERFLRDLHARPGVRPEQIFEVSLDGTTHLANVHLYLARPIF